MRPRCRRRCRRRGCRVGRRRRLRPRLAHAGAPRARGSCADAALRGRSWRAHTTRRGHPHGRHFCSHASTDAPEHVDAARIDAHTLSLVVDSVSRQSYETTVSRRPGDRSADGHRRRRCRPGRGAERPAPLRPPKTRAVAPGAAPQRLAAPMPGKVVRVLVKAGDVVHAASAARRRRSDEDGERAARQPRRNGRRGPRPRRACRSRPARCSSSFSEVASTSDVSRGSQRDAVLATPASACR